MTEVQTETPAVEAYDTSTDSPVLAMIRSTLSAQVAEGNALAERISASKQGTGGLVHAIRETDETVTDDNVLKFRARKDKVLAALLADEAKIDDYIKATLIGASDFDADAAGAAFKVLKGAVKAGQDYARTAPGFSEAYLTSLPTLKGVRGSSAGGGSGTGGKRPRLDSLTINGESIGRANDDGTHTANFTLAAAWLQAKAGGDVKVKPSDLHAAAFAAAGTDDLSTLNGKAVDFVVNVGDVNYALVIVPRVKTPADDSADETVTE